MEATSCVCDESSAKWGRNGATDVEANYHCFCQPTYFSKSGKAIVASGTATCPQCPADSVDSTAVGATSCTCDGSSAIWGRNGATDVEASYHCFCQPQYFSLSGKAIVASGAAACPSCPDDSVDSTTVAATSCSCDGSTAMWSKTAATDTEADYHCMC